jgi:uncharacterized protein (TIGR00369 family)
MSDPQLIQALAMASAASPFHQVTGFTVADAGEGFARIVFEDRPELRNHAAALHAGVQCAALDTVAGYAAATLAGAVVTLQITTQFLSSAKGERFEAVGRVTKAGKSQLFVDSELHAHRAGGEAVLVAKAAAVLTRVG